MDIDGGMPGVHIRSVVQVYEEDAGSRRVQGAYMAAGGFPYCFDYFGGS